jgi:hypothetical protein
LVRLLAPPAATLTALKRLLKQLLVIDGRNLYEPEGMQQAGFRYLAVGRGNADGR